MMTTKFVFTHAAALIKQRIVCCNMLQQAMASGTVGAGTVANQCDVLLVHGAASQGLIHLPLAGSVITCMIGSMQA